MTEDQSKPLVIVVSGSMGSGKTTIIKKLSEILGGAPTLIFDHYENYVEWPPDMDQWLQDGADPNQVTVPRMKEDLLSLLAGKSITHPLDKAQVNPSANILVEDPFGRERSEIAPFVDLLVFVDTPKDVCVVRLVQRALGLDDRDFEQVIQSENRAELLKRLKTIAGWLNQYLWIRPGLAITEIIKQHADIIIDGMLPVDEMAQDALAGIKSRLYEYP